MDERQPTPGIPIETSCIAGHMLRGVTSEEVDLLTLTCQSEPEQCFVRCQLTQIIYKREYQEGEGVARGTVSGYCSLSNTGFVLHHAVFTVAPPDQQTDVDPVC